MPNYSFMERVHVYYTVQADSEDEAWEKLDKMDVPYQKSFDSNISYEVVQCEIENIWEDENAELN